MEYKIFYWIYRQTNLHFGLKADKGKPQADLILFLCQVTVR